MMENVVLSFYDDSSHSRVIHCLNDWLMMSFCLQNVKNLYKLDYVSEEKSKIKNFSK